MIGAWTCNSPPFQELIYKKLWQTEQPSNRQTDVQGDRCEIYHVRPSVKFCTIVPLLGGLSFNYISPFQYDQDICILSERPEYIFIFLKRPKHIELILETFIRHLTSSWNGRFDLHTLTSRFDIHILQTSQHILWTSRTHQHILDNVKNTSTIFLKRPEHTSILLKYPEQITSSWKRPEYIDSNSWNIGNPSF